MTITKASSSDVQELNRLVNSAYRGEGSKAGWTTEAEILDGIRIDEDALRVLLDRPKVSILKCMDETGQILGTVCLEIKAGKLYLGMFAVSPGAQGAGIGKSLLKESEIFALSNNCEGITISVIDSRIELIDWYARHGYLPTGEYIGFEEIQERFGDPKVAAIRLIEMEKLLYPSIE